MVAVFRVALGAVKNWGKTASLFHFRIEGCKFRMNYYTMNIGRQEYSPRSEISDGSIQAIWGILSDDGWHSIPVMPGYVVDVSRTQIGLFATIARRANDITKPLATLGVADNEEDGRRVWKRLEQDYLRLGDQPGYREADLAAPRMPTTIPWCAVYRLEQIDVESLWLSRFERALAWTWVEWRRRRRT